MVSPLVPILANLFMGHLETTWLENYTVSKGLFYGPYVDEFRVFETEHEADLLCTCNYINPGILTFALLWRKTCTINYLIWMS